MIRIAYPRISMLVLSVGFSCIVSPLTMHAYTPELESAIIAASPRAETIARTDPKTGTSESLVIRRGDTFTISLESNPELAYEWFLAKNDKRLINLENHYEFRTSGQMAVVAPEKARTDKWTFRARGAKRAKTEIVFHLRRPWKDTASASSTTQPERTHTAYVTIR